jgi:signal peptidase II
VKKKPAKTDLDPAESMAVAEDASAAWELQNQRTSKGERPGVGRVALFFLPAVIGLAADLWTKSYMFANHFSAADAAAGYPQRPHWWAEGIFGIQTSTNPGALFGIGSGYSWLFAGFSVVALLGIIVWVFRFGGFTDRWLTFALGLVSGGIVGNFYDRVGLGFTEGFPEDIRYNVRDWVLFRLEGVTFFDPWPNFNIADSVLVAGAIMLFVHAFMFQPDEAQAGNETPTGNETPVGNETPTFKNVEK